MQKRLTSISTIFNAARWVRLLLGENKAPACLGAAILGTRSCLSTAIAGTDRQIRVPSNLTLALAILLLSLLAGIAPAQAQENRVVQILTGRIEPGEIVFYDLPGLEEGQTLYVYAQGTSRNLDPFVGLADANLDRTTLRAEFTTEFEQNIAAGRDPLEVVPEFADQVFLAWNDDGGPGYAAALEFAVPADGNYQLLVFSAPGKRSFGDYRLLIGLNAPDVLTGEAIATGDTIANFNERDSLLNAAVDEVSGTLTAETRSQFFTLRDVEAGDTLTAFVEATSGDLKPILILEDFGNKPLRTANFSGQMTSATLEYTFDGDSRDDRLRVTACCQDGAVTEGEYRLLVGLNTPEVLTGQAATTDQAVLIGPGQVRVGIKMDQITGVDQKSENFGAVVDLRMEWTDPALAFSPDTCQCRFQTFRDADFIKYLSEKGVTRWPAFTVFNQQGRRDSQGQVVVVRPNGAATYVERFSTTLQAPDFDFRMFPFDQQQFFIRVRSVFPEEFFAYTDLEGFSGLGEQLGEEEWVVTDFGTTVDTSDGSSRFSFGFEANRHLNFYVFRFFLPILIIILVSWLTFFLKDYGRRVEVASGNLLIFIAYNFTIGDELPRLGYLTLMDVVLISTFVVTAFVVIFSVYLKRLELTGQEARAHRLDRYVITAYPVAYALAIALAIVFII